MTRVRQIWLVTAMTGDDEGETHTFSSFDKARKWAEARDDMMLIYSSVVDHPEMSHMVMQ